MQGGYFKAFTPELGKKLAYEALAKQLGIERLVPHTKLCFAVIDGLLIKGSIQEKSKGKDVWEVPKKIRKKSITPEFQRDINILRLFDVICHERDHSLNNYFAVSDSHNRYVTVSAFDNGGIGSFNLHTDISFSTYYGCTPLIDKKGIFTSPYVDKEFTDQILELPIRKIFKNLYPYIGIPVIITTIIRLQKVRYCIKHCKFKLVESSSWNERTIEDELSGKYGNTYLYSFANQWGES